MDTKTEMLDFGLGDSLFALGLKGTLEYFSSEGLHTHPFHQAIHIRNGVALLEDAAGKQPQYGNTVAFVPAFAPHRTEVIGTSVEYQSLYFGEALLPWEDASIRVFGMSALGISLLDYLNEDGTIDGLKRGIRRDCVELFVKVLALDAATQVSPILLPNAGREANIAVCRFIEDNYQRRIGAGDVEGAFPLSFRQLSRQFKSELGLGIFEYLRLFRMLKASIQLNTTEAKVVTVAYDCGYESISTFFADFKRTFGASPAQFRSRHKGNSNRESRNSNPERRGKLKRNLESA